MAKAVKSAFKWVGKAVGAVVGVVAKPIIRALTPKVPEVDTSSAVNFRANPDAGVPYVIGQTGTAGVYTYATVGEAKNRNLLFYTILSGGGPIDSFVSFKMGDVSVVFDGADTPESGPYRHLVWMRKQTGAPGSPALMPPNTLDAGVLAEWTSAHKTTGYAAAWYVLGADQTAYANGVPDPMWELRGVKVYDWRQDDTYPGGEGLQRADDPSTWTFSENPALHAVTWCLGRYQNGKRVLGLGATRAQIVMERANEWANVCDANGWKVGGVVYSTDTKWQVLKAICQAGGAYPTPLGTQISFIFNAPRVSIATLTGADIEADPSIVGAQLRRDRFNRGVARYREKNNNWQIVPSAPLTVAEFVTQDGGVTRTKEFEWPLVQDVDQAAQLLAYGMCNSRELGPLEFAVTPPWAGLEPGDCITINEPEFGLTSQKVIIAGRSRSLSDFGRSLTCVTETDSKHSFCLGQTGTPPPLPSLSAVDTIPTPPDAGDWVVTIGSITGPGGTQPAIVLDGAVSDPNAIEIIVEYRAVGDTGEWTTATRPVTATHIELGPVRAGVTYDVRIRYRYARNTEDPVGGNTGIGTVTTPAIDAGTLGGVTESEMSADIAAAQAAADAAYDALFDPSSGAIVQIEALQDQDAVFVSQIAVLTTDQASTAAAVTTVQAQFRSGSPNRLLNSDFSDGWNHWLSSTGSFTDWGYGIDPSRGSLGFTSAGTVGDYIYQDVPASVGVGFSLSTEGEMSPANGQIFFQFLNPARTAAVPMPGTPAYPVPIAPTGWDNPRAATPVYTAPSGTGWIRVFVYRLAAGVLVFSRLMIQSGAPTAWRDDASSGNSAARVTEREIANASDEAALASFETTATADINGLQSTVTTQGTAISGLTGRTASYLTKVAAAGADPAYIYMQSDATAAGGTDSYISLAAKSLNLFNIVGGVLVKALYLIGGEAYFGAPVSIDVGGKRLTLGPGFGASSDLVMWFGPNTTAIGSMTKTNGYWVFATDGKVYYGAAELGQPAATGSKSVALNASLSGSSWQNPMSLVFTSRPAGGFWSIYLSVRLAELFSGTFGNSNVEWRLTEVQSGVVFSSGTMTFDASAGAGGGQLPVIGFSPPGLDGLVSQSAPAGTVELRFEFRQITATGNSWDLIEMEMSATYTPPA